MLADAEKSLRDLMQRELKAQRYGELAELAAIADALARLSRGGLTGEATNALNTAPQARRLPAAPSTTARALAKGKSIARNKPAKRDYPRFERDGDKLIKVGWSKKSREEYEHRAPRAAVLAFAEHVGANTVKGKTFVIEELLPVHDAAGEELPGYQVYLALAWLRQVGVVEKKGRDGYLRVVDPLDGSLFDILWEQTRECP